MVYASIEHPAVLGGKVKTLDDQDTLKVAGVRQTVSLDPFKPPAAFQPLGGVAVIADNTWAAFEGRKKLKIDWDHGANESYDSVEYKKELRETAHKPGKVIREVGDSDKAFATGGTVFEADYYVPLLAHAPMEPMTRWRNSRWEDHRVGADAESAGGAGDRVFRTGHPCGRCDLQCDFAGRRIWKEI